MKATGIVRRIDDLGRVVIPKEIRRTLRIKEGTPLEIFTDREGVPVRTPRSASMPSMLLKSPVMPRRVAIACVKCVKPPERT